MPLATGTRLGPYEIAAPLGAGGMGEVYRARDTRLGREVAVKVLPQHLSENAEVRARFEREAKTVSSLSHPHICTLFDVGRDGLTDYLVMELVEGETLAAKLEKGPLPISDVLRLGGQIADALARAHRAGVVHRDLKPGNVMLTRAGAKLMDFGLARATQDTTPRGHIVAESPRESPRWLSQSPTVARPLTAEGAIIGTFQYMSPEQLEGKEADRRSDLWALGCVLYEMATGKRAFDGKSQASLIAAIMQSEPPSLTKLSPLTPPGLERLVRQCMAKDPDERWQDARDLALQLDWLREGVGPAAAVAGSTEAIANSTFRPMTFRRGTINGARFLPDGQTIVYSAAWGGSVERVYMVRTDSNESAELALPPGSLIGVSRQGELALSLGRVYLRGSGETSGTLARAPLFGGAPREVMEDVHEADWGPDGRSIAVIRRVRGDFQLEYPIGRVLHVSKSWMNSPRVSPDGQRVAFVEYFQILPLAGEPSAGLGNVLRVVEADGNAAARTLASLDHWPGRVCWAPDRTELLFCEWGGKNGSVIGGVSLDGQRRTLARLPGTIELHDVSRSGDLLVSQFQMNFTTSVFRRDDDRERDLSWLDMGLVKDLTPDGKRLLMDEQGAGVNSDAQVFLRNVDGSPPIHLGAGLARAISPDGKWALTEVGATLTLMPTGSGQPLTLDTGDLAVTRISAWFPDSEHIVFQGTAPGRPMRLYRLSIRGGEPRPLTPEGIGFPLGIVVKPVSEDGKRLFALASPGDLRIHHIESGEEVGALELAPGEEPLRWHADHRSIFSWTPGEFPATVRRIQIESGEREVWKTLMPADPTGVNSTRFVVVTPDGETCALSYIKMLSQLHVIRGLH